MKLDGPGERRARQCGVGHVSIVAGARPQTYDVLVIGPSPIDADDGDL